MISYLIAILFFLILEAFFSGSELALFSVNRSKLKYMANNGDKKAEKIYKALENKFDDYVATTLIGTTLSIVTITALFVNFLIGLETFIPFLHSKEELFAESIIVVTLLFGEILPKSVFQHYADKLIYFIVPVLEFFRKILYPFLIIAKIITRIVLFIFRLEPKKVGEIVVPLSDVIAVSDSNKIRDILHLFKDTGFSRIPVYRKRIDQIVGIIRAYDLVEADLDDSVKKFLKPIRYIPEFTSLPNVLKGFKQFKDHMAVVVDERGATMGIITIEDVLEEIVGDIRDEFSQKEKKMIKRQTTKELIVDGRIEIKEIETIIGEKLPEGPYETVGGMIIYILGRKPKPHETLTLGNVKFTVLKTNIRRVQEVKIEKINQEKSEEI